MPEILRLGAGLDASEDETALRSTFMKLRRAHASLMIVFYGLYRDIVALSRVGEDRLPIDRGRVWIVPIDGFLDPEGKIL